jgi:hypothetical protein
VSRCGMTFGVPRTMKRLSWIVGVWLIASVPAARAEWPARVFAPYMYLGAGDDFLLTDCDDACGQKFYTLAFVIADKQHKPAWDGRVPMERDLYAEQVTAIRKRGGDVIVSFGGEAGSELALVETDAAQLAAMYQSVIDRYQFTWLDFDIEGKALHNMPANERRNAAIAQLQAKNPALLVTFTLPVDPEGIPVDARRLLADAKAKGVKVHSANIMTMYFGERFTKGKKMSDVAQASAIAAHEQCAKIDPAIAIGLCPMIGHNEVNETFTLEDAQRLKDWTITQPWVCSMTFWCANRDKAKGGRDAGNTKSGIEQEPWAFTKVFQTFMAKP